MFRSLAIALLLLALVGEAAGAETRLKLSFELGPEVDSNPARITGDDLDQSYDGNTQIAAPLLRAVAQGQALLALGSHRLALGYGGGAKLYLTDEGSLSDELVQHASASWLALVTRHVSLGVAGRYYDAFLKEPTNCNTPAIPCPPRRDFRNIEGGIVASIAASRQLVATVRSGYQRLEFKPAPVYSYHGAFGSMEIRRNASTGRGDAVVDWSFAAAYTAAVHRFGGAAQIPAPCGDAGSDDCAVDGPETRWDLAHRLHVEGSYLGPAEASLWYTLEVNDSNSYGESYRRHGVGIRFTTPLFWEIFLTVTGVLQFSRFSDPLYARLATQAFIDIEAENRSRLVLHLGRDIGAGFSISARYSLYVNESATTSEGRPLPGFMRHTSFFGLRYEYGE